MSTVIYKYTIVIDAQDSITLPEGSEFLHAAIVHRSLGGINFWFKVDTSKPDEVKRFVIRGTGHRFNGDEGKHLATVVTETGTFVWHIFEMNEH